MDRWMDGWMDGWTNGWMDGWTDGRTDGRMDNDMDIVLKRYREAYVGRCIDEKRKWKIMELVVINFVHILNSSFYFSFSAPNILCSVFSKLPSMIVHK
jgi:hypothetical protein